MLLYLNPILIAAFQSASNILSSDARYLHSLPDPWDEQISLCGFPGENKFDFILHDNWTRHSEISVTWSTGEYRSYVAE